MFSFIPLLIRLEKLPKHSTLTTQCMGRIMNSQIHDNPRLGLMNVILIGIRKRRCIHTLPRNPHETVLDSLWPFFPICFFVPLSLVQFSSLLPHFIRIENSILGWSFQRDTCPRGARSKFCGRSRGKWYRRQLQQTKMPESKYATHVLPLELDLLLLIVFRRELEL